MREPHRRRLPPLYPGDVRSCPNGCPQRAAGEEDWPPPVMPSYAPPCGYWNTICLFCGWVARYVLRHGDREQDIYWVVTEDVSAEESERLREWALHQRLRLGLGPWPHPAGG